MQNKYLKVFFIYERYIKTLNDIIFKEMGPNYARKITKICFACNDAFNFANIVIKKKKLFYDCSSKL